MSNEVKVMTAILHAVQAVPGVVVFDPPDWMRSTRNPKARETYRRYQEDRKARLAEALRRYGAAALVYRRNVGGAYQPGKAGRMRPVFYGYTGQPDIEIVLAPSGRLVEREVKSPDRRTLKSGDPGGHLSIPSIEQRTWGEIYELAGVSWDVWRSSEDAIGDIRSLLMAERRAA